MNITEDVLLTDRLTESLDFGVITVPVQATESPDYSFTNGTAAKQIDLHWEKAGTTAVTLAASATVTYTLSALTDALGRSVAFARVRKLVIRITSKTDGDALYLVIGNAATHEWLAIVGGAGQTLSVRDMLVLIGSDTTGYVVTSGSSDQIKITNSSSHSVTFEIWVSGASV